jgi:hypothetical protein
MNSDVGVLGVFFGTNSNFVVESLRESLHHTGTTSEYNIVVKADLKVGVALLNGFNTELSDTHRWRSHWVGGLLVNIIEKARGKNNFSSFNSLSHANFNNFSTRELIWSLLLV